jgi:AraC-like DNA-binding protein
MDATNFGRVVFNTDALPERDRFDAFCEAIFRNIIGTDIVRTGTLTFHGELDLRQAGAVAIAKIATTSAEIIRNAQHMRDGNDAIVVQLWPRGRAAAFQDKHENEVTERAGFVIDNGRPARICARNAVRFWSLQIPRNIIGDQIPNVDLLAGARLRNELSLGLLFGYLEGTLKQGLDDDPATRLFGNHLVELVALALGRESNEHEVEASSGVRAARAAVILQAISKHSAHQRLSAASIGAQLGITSRYVHLLLEQSGHSFTQHVLQKRLEKAEKLLRDDHDRKRKIADIATEAGFNDISHFNRPFRRQFGDTPSSVRANYAKRHLHL